MHSLRELQLGFSNDVFSDGKTGFSRHIRAAGLSGERRLQVYRHNTYLSFTDALRTTYPVVQRLVGDGFFRYASHQYITRHPATSGDLHEFGETFAEFLAAFEPCAGLPYLADVARLEWAYERAFYAAERPPMDPMAMAGVAQERYGELKFTFNPASRLLASSFPILRIWQVNREEDEQAVNLDEGGVRLLVIRHPSLDVEIQILGEGEFALLEALAGGSDFASACDQALERQPDCDVPAVFRRHIAQGTLVDFFL